MASIVITTQPQAATVTYGAISGALSIVPAGSQGTITYQWKVGSLANGSDLVDIANATSSSFTIPTDSPGGVKYYACLLGTDAELDDTLSAVVSVTVDTGEITITTQPANQVVAADGDPVEISVVASYVGADAIAYQWYSCSDSAGADPEAITDATSAAYTPSGSLPGHTYYYYCSMSASDMETPVLTSIVSLVQYGDVTLITMPAHMTAKFANDYIAQCSLETQTRFAALQVSRGITIPPAADPDEGKVLRTAQVELFMDAI